MPLEPTDQNKDPYTDAIDSEVGFGKPPQEHRFKPGVSGNPKGRPRGTRNISTLLKQCVSQTVIINERGKRKKISKMEAALTQLANKAASGESNAIKFVVGLVQFAEAQDDQRKPASIVDNETDKKLMERLFAEIEQSSKGGQS